MPAWATNRLKRLARTPKRYAIDPGLVGAALQVDAEGVLRDGALAGRVLDTFVMNQVRAELHASDQALRAYRLRLEGGRHEFDLLVETPDGRLIAIEVKVEAAPSTSSARHLSWLRGEVNDRFVVGMILHTGPRSYVLGDRLLALPSAVCGREGASRQRFDGTGDELGRQQRKSMSERQRGGPDWTALELPG